MTASLILFYSIAVLNIIAGISKKHVKLFYGLALAVIFLFMTFNCAGPDISGYMSAYDQWINSEGVIVHKGHMEWGYMMLMSVCRRIGLDFFSFRIILSLLCLGLMVSTINYYKVNPNFVVGLYMTYLFFFDTIQLRNCVAEFILLFATRYLFKKSFLATVKYIILVLLAWGFHTIALFSLLLLLFKISDKKIYYRCITVLSVLMFAVCVILQPVLPQIANWLLQFITRGSSYLEINVEIGYLVILILQLVGFIPLYLCRRAVKNNKAVRKNVDNIFKINIILFLFMPLMFINSNFYRIYRNYILLTIIGLTLIYGNSKARTSSGGFAAIALLLLNIGWFIRDMIIKNDIKVIINPIFDGNIITNFTQTVNAGEWIAVAAVAVVVFAIFRFLYTEHTKRLRVSRVGKIR